MQLRAVLFLYMCVLLLPYSNTMHIAKFQNGSRSAVSMMGLILLLDITKMVSPSVA
jgi:hypothetical protein